MMAYPKGRLDDSARKAELTAKSLELAAASEFNTALFDCSKSSRRSTILAGVRCLLLFCRRVIQAASSAGCKRIDGRGRERREALAVRRKIVVGKVASTLSASSPKRTRHLGLLAVRLPRPQTCVDSSRDRLRLRHLDQRPDISVGERERLITVRVVCVMRHVVWHHHVGVADLFIDHHRLDEDEPERRQNMETLRGWIGNEVPTGYVTQASLVH